MIYNNIHRVFAGFGHALFLGWSALGQFPNVFITLYTYTTRTTRTHNARESWFRQTRKRVYRTEVRRGVNLLTQFFRGPFFCDTATTSLGPSPEKYTHTHDVTMRV
jgi:hypothetical protein